MRLNLFFLCVSALERVISTRSRHQVTGHEMWLINRFGKAICKLFAGKDVRAQKSLLHELVYNALDSLDDGLDYLRFVETYQQYISALSGDESEIVCSILLKMTSRYRCTQQEISHLHELMAGSKHWQHYYREYC